jgi:peptide/nickel transport system ATP-binding protein
MAGSGTAHLRDAGDVLLRAEHVHVQFSVGRRRRTLHAVDDLSLDVRRGETLGLVGESGCGKSSFARALMQIPPPTSGSVMLGEVELTSMRRRQIKRIRPQMQMIFQDPISSLNPRRRVFDIVEEPLKIWGRGDAQTRRAAVEQVLDHVGLGVQDARSRRPHEFSGGQCQRVSIARALVLNPDLVICDEPVSALDVSVQAQILNLLEDMKEEYALTLVFIAHDLAVVKHVSDRIAVMYLGKLCEVADPDALYVNPAHPYTAALLQSVPVLDPEEPTRERINVSRIGEPPSPLDPPSGCRFRTRCPRAASVCAEQEPELRLLREGQFVACHFPVAPGEPV